MTAIATLAEPRTVVLDEVRRGLVDPSDGCRDLDAVLDRARAAELEGAEAVEVPHGGRHWPATAQALAVLLATSTVRVVVPVEAAGVDVAALARFAQGATRLAGDRLVVRVLGGDTEAFASRLRARWEGRVTEG